ncbi:MAG: heavy metal transporter [Stigonema ocellatum SAG 48.90 = DSM 106950]|nr:heavy metal transporter [Stigonema ocellatum SAG 48.90 = DSM 106950]
MGSRRAPDLLLYLFYTGLTRTKRLAIVVGSKKAISLALRSKEAQQRYTQLQQRLVRAF